MKKTLLSSCMLLLCALAFGQAKNGTVAFRNASSHQPAAMIFLPYSPEVVEWAMQNFRAARYSFRNNPQQGYQAFQNTLLVQNNVNGADLIFQIGLKHTGDKNTSVVYLMLDSPIEDVANSGTVNHFKMAEAIAYLDNLALAIRPYALDRQIKLQTSVLDKAEARQARLVNRGQRLDSRKAGRLDKTGNHHTAGIARNDRLSRSITDNRDEQFTLEAEIKKQKQDLAVLNRQRANR